LRASSPRTATANRRVLLAAFLLAGLAACGRKGDVTDLLPPPAPESPAPEKAPESGG
jgi:predicted small lipoprotein YifL